MKCPADGTTLVMSERQGVEIDYCPECRGVWLDRGELDKIIDRADDDDDRPRVDRDYDRREADYRQYPEDVRYDRPGYKPGYKKKKRGFLGELFEFDD